MSRADNRAVLQFYVISGAHNTLKQTNAYAQGKEKVLPGAVCEAGVYTPTREPAKTFFLAWKIGNGAATGR